MAVNQFRQRLMAAGASPERADGMIQQRAFETGAPIGMPASVGKPKGPNEWYNEDYATASQSLFPGGFRPPTPDSTDFSSYYDFVFGKGSYQKVFDKELKLVAPTYRTASLSNAKLDQFITTMINDGLDLNTIAQRIRDPRAQANLIGYGEKAGQKNILIPFTADQAIFRANEIYDDYMTGKAKVSEKVLAAANSNKNYKYGLPDPKLRYGLTTNISAGQVDILTNPTAAKAYAAYQNTTTNPQQLAQYKQFLLSEANKRQLTPWKDEAKRRDYLKGKKIGG